MDLREENGFGELLTGGVSNDWQRPEEWIPIPSINQASEEVIYILMGVKDIDSQVICFQVQSHYTVDWGDGTIENFATGVKAQHEYDYSTLSASTELPDGQRQALIKITPQATFNLTGLSFNFIPTNYSTQTIVGILDLIVNCPNLVTLAGFYSGYMLPYQCERYWIMNPGNITSAYRCYMNFYNLKNCPVWDTSNIADMHSWWVDCKVIEEIGAFDLSSCLSVATAWSRCWNLKTLDIINTESVQNWSLAFDECTFEEIPSNISFTGATNMNSMLQGNSMNSFVRSDTSNVQTATYLFNEAINATEIIEMDCSSMTTGANFPRSFSLKRCILTGMRYSFTVANADMSADELNAMFTSLGTADGAQTVTATGNPGSATCDPTIATAKGWTVSV